MEYDVLIVGNGLASNLIVRHFLLKEPSIKIGIVGLSQDRKFKVGESLTEGASHYLMHRLQLSSYMFRHQLYKNGMRFHFNNEDCSLPFARSTELGLRQPLIYNTFHIDRFVLEEDLIEMNKAKGAHYHVCKVKDIVFTQPLNVVKGESEGQEATYQAKWILDGTGGARVIAKKLGLCQGVENNHHASVWGHFKSAHHIDHIAKEKSRSYYFVNRELSTNHFVGFGYWIWVIPLMDGTISIGVVYDSHLVFEKGTPNKQEFLEFIQAHDGLKGLFDEIDLISFASRANYSYTSSQFICSQKRYALLADAAAFCDPLYSPGIDSMGRQSDWYTHVILNSLKSKEACQEIEVQTKRANESLTYHYNTYFNAILGSNACLGSAQLEALRFTWDAYTFYLSLLWPFLDDKVESQDVKNLPISASLTGIVQRVIATNFNVLFHHYRKEGLYYRYNADCVAGRDGILNLAEGILSCKLDEHYLKLRSTFVLEIFNLTWLRQLEYYFKRKDLLCAGELIDQLQITHLPTIHQGQKKSPDFFFKVMGKLLHEMDEAKSEEEFWKKWMERYFKGVETHFLGASFLLMSRRQVLMPLRLWSSQPEVRPRHPDPLLQSIAQEYQKVMQRPQIALKAVKEEDSHYFFRVEAIAAGLILQGQSIEQVKKALGVQGKPHLMPLVAIGCGVGLYYSQSPEILAHPLEKKFLDNLIDGFGFAMGLDGYLSNKPVNFPGENQRYFLIRGIGRSVTYYNFGETSANKYRDYFLLHGFYPSDERAYYEGVGFSLCFSKSLSGKQILDLGFEPHLLDFVKEGIEQALIALK